MPSQVVDTVPELNLEIFQTDPAVALDAVRPHPVVRSTRGFEVIGYEAAYALLGDQRLQPMSAKDFASHGATPKIAEFVNQGVFLFMPPDRHREIRKIFARAFAVKRVNESREVVLETAHSLVDRLVAGGDTGDLVADFTQRFTAEVLCRFLGFPPSDIPQFVNSALDLRHLVYVPMEPHVATIEAALDSLRTYATELLNERRRSPRGDFLSVLIEAEGGKLTTAEVVWGTVNLLLAGIDTTNFQLASTLQHLIASAAWDSVADDSALREVAIEEATRLTPISTMLSRICHEITAVGGVEIPRGASVRINLVGAGRDPERFTDPHSFRLDRTPPFFPAAFGNGVHVCIGKNLAWQELRTGLEVLTGRLTGLAFTANPSMHAWTDAFYGPYELPVAFRPR